MGADSKSNMQQIFAAVFDTASQSFKVVSGPTSLVIDHVTDSVTSFPVPVNAAALGNNTTTGVVIPAQAASGVGSVALYVTTLTTIVGPQALTVEVSPDGTNWSTTAITVTPSLTAGVTLVSGPTNIAALQVRVSIAAAITSGTFKVSLINGK